MNFELLKAFVAVADARGFTKAGDQLHKTQSTISQQIARLEREVGRSLLARDTRNIGLTDHGEQFLGYARRILALEDEAHAVMNAREPITFLRLGVPEDFAVTRLPAILEGFSLRHRHVRLEVVSALSVDLQARLTAGQLDVAIVKEADKPRGALKYWRESLQWVARQNARLPLQDPVPLVVFPQGCIYRSRALAALETAGRKWRIAYESPNWSGIKAAVESGLGVSLLSRNQASGAASRLSRMKGFPPVPATYLVLRAQRTPRGATTQLVEEIAKLVPQGRAGDPS